MAILAWCHLSRSTSRALQQWWRLTVVAPQSRLMKWLMWAWHEALGQEGWTRVKQWEGHTFLHSFSSIWNFPFSHSLSISCPSSRLSPHILSMKPSWSHSLPAGFLRPSLHLSFLLKDHLILLHHLYTCTQLLSAPESKICAPSSVLDPDDDYL